MKHIKKNIFWAMLFLLIATGSRAQSTVETQPQRWSVRLFGSPLITNNTSNLYSNEEKTSFGFNFGGDLVYT
ncbi:MAG: hypothetical protein WCG93_07855, partial [Paludibacter sp.]